MNLTIGQTIKPADMPLTLKIYYDIAASRIGLKNPVVGVRYDGIQEGDSLYPSTYQFTVMDPNKHTTFNVIVDEL